MTHTLIPVGIYNARPLGTLITKKAMLDQESSSLIYLLTSASHAKYTLSHPSLPPARGCSFHPMVVPTDPENSGYSGGHLYPALRSRDWRITGASVSQSNPTDDLQASKHLSQYLKGVSVLPKMTLKGVLQPPHAHMQTQTYTSYVYIHITHMQTQTYTSHVYIHTHF